MRRILRICILTSFTFFATLTGLAQSENSAQQLYQEGLGLYQKKQWQEAAKLWSQALEIEPNNPYILYNLGLAKSQLGEFSLALAYVRKTLAIKPRLSQAHDALKIIAPKIGQPVPASVSLFTNPLPFLQRAFSPELTFLITLVFLTLFLWFLFEILGQRKRNSAENPVPLKISPFFWVSLAFFLLFLPLSALQLLSPPKKRATVVAANVFAKSTPDQESTDLFQIPEGADISLERKKENWVQVRLSGGLRGWVSTEKIYQTHGDKL